MHGIIFSELRKYVETKVGPRAWTTLLDDTGLDARMYLPIQEYPDSEMFALVATASRVTGTPIATILEDFGRYIAPSLLGLYRTLVAPGWRTLDLLENTESTIHSVVRARNPGARPAELKVVRRSPESAELTYTSQRRLCAVAKGIIRGVADHYRETVELEETTCMHQGADACRIDVRVPAVRADEGVTAASALAALVG